MADFQQQLNAFADKVTAKINQAIAWLDTFFKQIDTYELLAVIAIGVGLILVIVGLILL